MRKQVKLTKKTAEDLGGAFDIYDAEVSSGEYKADLWEIDESNTLLLEGAEGAAMFLSCAFGEVMNCYRPMSDFIDRDDYNRAYRMRKRITKLMQEVEDSYEDQIVRNYYGQWEAKA
jgi:hypothetical protein